MKGLLLKKVKVGGAKKELLKKMMMMMMMIKFSAEAEITKDQHYFSSRQTDRKRGCLPIVVHAGRCTCSVVKIARAFQSILYPQWIVLPLKFYYNYDPF